MNVQRGDAPTPISMSNVSSSRSSFATECVSGLLPAMKDPNDFDRFVNDSVEEDVTSDPAGSQSADEVVPPNPQ